MNLLLIELISVILKIKQKTKFNNLSTEKRAEALKTALMCSDHQKI